MLKKLFTTLLVTSAFVWGLYIPSPDAGAALQGATVMICHANGDGTYSPRSILFDNAGDATRLAEQTPTAIIYHINDTAIDLWPALVYSDQYTQTYIAASHAFLMAVTTTKYVSTRYFHGWVTTTTYVPDPAKAAIYANGCAT